jgi:hypothetical protein
LDVIVAPAAIEEEEEEDDDDDDVIAGARPSFFLDVAVAPVADAPPFFIRTLLS